MINLFKYLSIFSSKETNEFGSIKVLDSIVSSFNISSSNILSYLVWNTTEYDNEHIIIYSMDLDNKKILSKTIDSESNFITSTNADFNSYDETFVYINSGKYLRIITSGIKFNITLNKFIDYSSPISIKFLDKNTIVVNTINSLEIIDLINKKNISSIFTNESISNTYNDNVNTLFDINLQNNYLIFFCENTESNYLKLVELNTFKVLTKLELEFDLVCKDILFYDESKFLVIFSNSNCLYNHHINFFEVDKNSNKIELNKILLFESFLSNNQNHESIKFVLNTNTKEIFILSIVREINKSILYLHTIDINNYSIIFVSKTELTLTSILKAQISNNGKFLTISDSIDLEVFEILR